VNSNLFHNILNVATIVLAAATAGLLATGCVELDPGKLDCSASWVSPTITGYATMAVGGLKLAINVVRDGLAGLFKQQPPVV